MVDIAERRQENSKTLDLGKGKRQLVVSIGAIHYKDNYADKNESWKDIDLTWKGNKITKAPYELTRDGNKLTIRDKKSGEISTIEFLGDVGFDTDLEVVPEYSRVNFTRILKSDKAPKTARFKVTGKIPFRVRASDEDGDTPTESSLIDGILTETLKPDRAIKYPVRIDPTWQVGTGTDDCWRKLFSSFFDLAEASQMVGHFATNNKQYGGGMRFTNITIPQGATIDDGTHLTFRAQSTKEEVSVNTRISAEDIDNPATFVDDADVFDTRFSNRTAARVNWDDIPGWILNSDYNSPEIKTVIQEIVDRGGWASGQAIVIFWEDFENRSTPSSSRYRKAHSYDGSTTYAPKLVITYTLPALPSGDSQLAQLVQAGLV